MTTTPIYRIKNWDEDYETKASRLRPQDPMRWIKVKIKQGSSYLKLVAHKNGARHLGTFVAVAQVAATCFPRGYLVDSEGRGLHARDLSRKSRLGSWNFEDALPRLIDPNDVGWLEECSYADVLAAREQAIAYAIEHAGDLEHARTPDITQQNTTKQRTKKASADADAKKQREPIRPIDDEFIKQLQADDAYKHLNVHIEFRKMVLWCETRRKVPSRRRFLNWLNNAEKPMEVGHGSNQNSAQEARPGHNAGNGKPSAIQRTTEILKNRHYVNIVEKSLPPERPPVANPAQDEARPSD